MYDHLTRTQPCKLCGRPLIWFQTPDGERLPLDAGAPVYVVECTPSDAPGRPPQMRYAVRTLHAFVSHQAVCQQYWQAQREVADRAARFDERVVDRMERRSRTIEAAAPGKKLSREDSPDG